MPIPKADDLDYKEIQGGRPTVEKKGNLTTIIHDYEGGSGIVVTSHIDHGTVVMETERGPREFSVDLLRRFHGEPCEKQSRMSSGEAYPRRKV